MQPLWPVGAADRLAPAPGLHSTCLSLQKFGLTGSRLNSVWLTSNSTAFGRGAMAAGLQAVPCAAASDRSDQGTKTLSRPRQLLSYLLCEPCCSKLAGKWSGTQISPVMILQESSSLSIGHYESPYRIAAHASARAACTEIGECSMMSCMLRHRMRGSHRCQWFCMIHESHPSSTECRNALLYRLDSLHNMCMHAHLCVRHCACLCLAQIRCRAACR